MEYYLTGKQSQAIDKYTQEYLGTPGIILMERASREIAEFLKNLIKERKYENPRILSVVESGNNGGDAVATAWMLKDMGFEPAIYEINGISRKSESYIKEIEKAVEHGVSFLKAEQIKENVFAGYDIIIDGIFGVGLTREVTGVQKDIIDLMNKEREAGSVQLILSVDIPSGISSDTGHMLGTAVKADYTVTFEYIKYGMLFNEGRSYSGSIIKKAIGLYHPETLEEFRKIYKEYYPEMFDAAGTFIHYEYTSEEVKELLPERSPDSNKGSFGKVLVVAGSRDIYGAVYMAAEAAYRTGAGLVKIVTDIRNRDVLADKLPEAMMLTYDSDRVKTASDIKGFISAIHWADVILIGPGLGTEMVSVGLLKEIVENVDDNKYIIFDADALNIISGLSGVFEKLVRKTGYEHVIITPHMKEMERLLRGSGKDIVIDGIKETRDFVAHDFSDKNGIITVLKDARTVVGCTGSRNDFPIIYVNTTGNSGMSKGGSGDVLAGILAGLLAQNRDGAMTAYTAACMAVNIHGRAGDKAAEIMGLYSMLARDIIAAIPEILKTK